MVDLGQISDILGFRVQRDGATGNISIFQQKYVKDLVEKFNMDQVKSVSTYIESNLKLSKEMSSTTDEERHEMANTP